MPETVPNRREVVQRLREMQREVRRAVVGAHDLAGNAEVRKSTSADTIYGIDMVIEPVIEEFMDHWGKSMPLVCVAEGIEPEDGRVFPAGIKEEDAVIRVILDPVDGTRGLMYDKRPAWSLAGVAPNRGRGTKLSDIQVAVMTELPTSKMGFADVLWAIKGEGARGAREDVYARSARYAEQTDMIIHPSKADNITHGFAMVANFFPGTKRLSSDIMEYLVTQLIGPADVNKALVFEDQYISTGGQFYELIMGHDRFNADLRPLFYRIQRQPEGLCCHPYDCCTALIAQEAGVILTDGLGNPLDGPLDVTTGLSWAGYANKQLQKRIEPLVTSFLKDRGV